MSESRDNSLTKLPDELRQIFLHTQRQIRTFGDAILLADFTFTITDIAFNVDFGDEKKESVAESFRGLLYEAFGSRREFVDERSDQLAKDQEQYLQGLYAQGLVYLWTSLEAQVKQLIEALIKLAPPLLATSSIPKIKKKEPELLKLPESARVSYLADWVWKQSRCDGKRGVDKFDCILNAFGLQGEFSAEHKRRLLALHDVRNCIIHNDSVADKVLCQGSTWMGYKIGDRIVISLDDFLAYERSVLAYDGEIFYRLNKGLGAPQDFLTTLRSTLDGIISKHSGKT